jgi:FixJ family two-component response regulator
LKASAAQVQDTAMAAAPLISIVDDDDSLRLSLTSLIRSVGFQALSFASAEAFLSSTQARDSQCLIVDVRMSGMNGLELQRHIVAANWRLPIIFITSHVDDDVRAAALEAGAEKFLYKPFRGDELLNAMEAALRTRSE